MGFFDPVRSLKNMWGQGDDEFVATHDEPADEPAGYPTTEPVYSGNGSYGSTGYAPSYATPAHGKSHAHSPRRPRTHNPTLRRGEKNIYTIKPKKLDEATVAADCLKTGSAVIINLEAVDRVTAIRIVDFMSGVTYGIDGNDGTPGNAMKLGEMIFLFTPAEYEITSDETDYGANPEHIFRDVDDSAPQASEPSPAVPSYASSYKTPEYASERRPWER